MSELNLNVGNPAGVVALFGGEKKKKKTQKELSHTKRSEVREVLLSQQKIEEYFFFLSKL